MTLAEQFGVNPRGKCWCCGGLGLTVDDWDAVEGCLFCDGTGTQPASRQPVTDADLDAGAAALMQIIEDLRRMEGGEPGAS